ncbi:MAG: alkaline phosphatase D family protein [Parasphingorhabdus sp.]
MTVNIDRRQLMALGTFGLGALSMPASAELIGTKGFTHGVASGEPSQTSVLLWTRYVADGDAELSVQVADRADFHYTQKASAVMTVTAKAGRDHIAKVVVSDLTPGRWYFYRFIGPDGATSPIGRTRTLPEGPTSKFNLGVFSCSNMPFGYFNAYAHAATRNDLDLIVHTGDYLYEYGTGTYPSEKEALAGRVVAPSHEMIQLADYRLRYAAYRNDPDLQRLHQLFPMIAMWDDHEFTNDAHRDGAQNHDSSEGDWGMRKRVAEQVYREWLPVRDRSVDEPYWSEYQIGDLATIFMTESRISGRDHPAEIADALRGQTDIPPALAKFRDDVWQDPSRQMLGTSQEAWLGSAMRQSKASGTKWQVWAQQCIMGNLRSPQETGDWLDPNAPPFVQARVKVGQMAAQAGLPFNMDAWDGYPVARQRILKDIANANADLLVLTGDSHNGWAFNLDVDGTPVGVEMAGHSVTSPGFENFFKGTNPDDVSKALRGANEQLHWANTDSRGYMTVSLTPDSASSTWHFLDTIRSKSTQMKGQTVHAVAHGNNKFSMG